MNICLFGANHKTAEIEFREKIAFSNEDFPEAVEELAKFTDVSECVILSTCNRTEFYVVTPQQGDIFSTLESFLSKFSGFPIEKYKNYFYRKLDKEAIVHIFRVASGMDSMVLGEPQILGQLKSAYRISVEAGTTGAILNRLMNHAFTVGKRVRTETALGAGAVSVAYAAVELAQKIFHDLSKNAVLLIGAGETGELTAKHLREKGIGKLFITNRTFSRAKDLAEKLNGNALEFSQMHQVFHKVDIIIGATTTPEYLIRPEDLKTVLSKRRARPLFLIDLGVPRNFDPSLNKLEWIFLSDIDALEHIITQNIKKRQQEIPKAEKIISEEVEKFLEWQKGLQVTPTIISLREKIEKIRQKELKKYKNKLSETELRSADLISRAIVNKILHFPMVHLKKIGNGTPDSLLKIDVVREIFGLEDDK